MSYYSIFITFYWLIALGHLIEFIFSSDKEAFDSKLEKSPPEFRLFILFFVVITYSVFWLPSWIWYFFWSNEENND